MLQHLLVWVISRCAFYKVSPSPDGFQVKTCIPLLLIVAFGASCSNQLGKEDYVEWIRDYDNGLHVKKEYSDFVFDAQYQPSQYISLLAGNSRKEDGLHYYVLQIKPINPSYDLISLNAASGTERQERLYYFSYLFQNHISLEREGETIPCALFHFEQSDLSKERTFLLGFEQEQSTAEIMGKESTLVIQSPFISSLPVKIKFSTGNIPALKL